MRGFRAVTESRQLSQTVSTCMLSKREAHLLSPLVGKTTVLNRFMASPPGARPVERAWSRCYDR